MISLAVIQALLLQFPSPPPPPAPEVTEKVKLLAPRLVAQDPAERAKVEQQLLALGPEATDVLIELTKTADPELLEAIRTILPKYGPAAVPRLLFAAHRTPHGQRKAEDEAIAAVAMMGDAAMPELRKLLDTGYPSYPGTVPTLSPFQGFAIDVLQKRRATDELIRLLKHSAAEIRVVAACSLSNIADPRAPDAARIRDALIEGLSSPDVSVRRCSAVGLGDMRDQRAIPALLGRLSDSHASPRAAAAVGLAKMYERRLLRPLVRVARSDPQPGNRESVANALMRTHDPVAFRLGRRYKPLTLGPAEQATARMAYAIWLTVTGIAVYFLIRLGVIHSPGEGRWRIPRGAWWSALGVVALGVLWGGFIQKITGTVELLLLLVALPATAYFAWMFGPLLRGIGLPALGLAAGLGVAFLAPFAGLVGFLILSWIAPLVLILCLIIAAIVAWQHGRRQDPARLLPFRRATLVSVSAFYLGYGVAHLALWGYLGF